MDALRLAVGTLTAIPVRGPSRVTPRTATGALLLAPLAVLPLGVVVGLVLWGGGALELPGLAVGFAAVGALALGSRALHLDGLSDVADGLTASYSRERSLEVMKGGTAGPAGVAAVVIVLGVQAGALSTYVGSSRSALVAGLAVGGSRLALWIVCARPVPAARADGLGVSFTGRVPVAVAVIGWGVAAGLSVLVDPVRGPVTVLVAAVVVGLLVWRAVRRFGGVTGDVFGAAVEVALAVVLVGWAG